MESIEVIGNRKKKIIKYRYILIVVLIIIIIILLLLLFINIIKSKNKSKISKEELLNEPQQIEEENKEGVMVVEVSKTEEQQEQEAREEKEATGVIYLTFDDGPSSDSTPQILDILERRNIKATFFVLHYSEANEKYIKSEQQQGHTIALHGYTHTYSEVYQSADTCIENFRKIQEQVFATTGIKSNIIRFPGGSSNTISRKYCQGVMSEVTQRVVNEGFKYFDWNVDSDDAGHAKTSENVYNNVTAGIKPNRKNVVLMHDFAGNQKTIDALEGIINFGLDNGYVFRRITDDTPMVTHSVNN